MAVRELITPRGVLANRLTPPSMRVGGARA